MSHRVVEPPRRQRTYPTRGGFVAVLSNGAFLRLWMAQALSQTAQQTINFSLLIQVGRVIEERGVGGGNTIVALLILCFATPPIFFSALAGVIVDRSNKRNIMAGVNAGRALCISGYLFLNPRWPVLTTLLFIYALCFCFSTVGQLFGPAEGSTIPLLVGKEQLISANALFSLTFIGSQLLGFVTLGPLLTQLLALRNLYIIVVLLYLLCTGLILSLPPTPGGRDDRSGAARRTVWGDLREVWRYVGHDRLLIKAIAYLTVANSAFLMIATLAPKFISGILKLPPERLAAVLTPAGLGMLVGVVAVGRIGRHADRELLVDRALIAVSLMLLAFATIPVALERAAVGAGRYPIFTPPVIAAMVLAGGIGVANAFIIVPSQTLLQERSNEENRARVLSTFFTASNTAALIPILFAGVLGDLFGVVRVMVVIALLALTIGLLTERGRRRRRSSAEGGGRRTE